MTTTPPGPVFDATRLTTRDTYWLGPDAVQVVTRHDETVIGIQCGGRTVFKGTAEAAVRWYADHLVTHKWTRRTDRFRQAVDAAVMLVGLSGDVMDALTSIADLYPAAANHRKGQ